jgi:hypothetical protein
LYTAYVIIACLIYCLVLFQSCSST